MKWNPAITPPPADAAALPDAVRYLPGHVLAGRYRMIARLGKGGMGEVWRADDLVLGTPVALKIIYSADAEARTRILNEVRLARQITHPAICRVFDVGEGTGEVFYSMELVNGEDLATLVRRMGRLPVEKVIDIGQQLCDGLVAAHAQGILHRDLKPANVLIDADGLVQITDFGIAITRDAAKDATQLGTPRYMAPEQITASAPLTERTDIYALGLILYELLVGQPAYDLRKEGQRQPPKPSALISDVDSQLERAILKCISPDPRDRPASVLDVSGLLTSPATPKTLSQIWVWSAAAVLVAAIAGTAFFFRSPVKGGLTAQDTIILADFQNTTGEPVFDGALKVALAVALEQSPFLKIYPDNRAREALLLMQRPANEPLTRAMTREIARREQLKALVAGSIASLGSHYVLALEAINAETGEVLAREQVEVPAKEQVLALLGSISSKLREKLGESLAVVERFDAPLAQATTSSLEALHAYSLALDQGRMNPRLEAVPHLQRAIELDPNFAMAMALLSAVYRNNDRSVEAPVYARRAFDLRDRVSERERFFISWRYYVDAEQAWDKALDLSTAWTNTYPREAFAFNSLGLAASSFGRHEQAVAAFEEAIRLDPRFVPSPANLAGSLIALNRFDRANTVVQENINRGNDTASARRAAHGLAFLKNDAQAQARELEMIRRTPYAMWAFTLEARTSAFAGQVRSAHELYERAVNSAIGERLNELAAQWTIEDAEVHAIAGQCDEARTEITHGLALNRDNFTLERAARAYALCRNTDAMRLSDELATRFPAAILTLGIQRPVIAAALALGHRDFQRAVRLLEPVKPYDHAPAAEFWPAYLRGEALLGLKDGPAAALQFQSIIDSRGRFPTSPIYALAHRGAARAAALSGDTAKARAMFDTFFSLWNRADDRRLIDETRAEYARLR